MIIGIFTPARDGGWTGSIRTLTLDAKLRLIPHDNRDGDKAPAFRVLLGHTRIGDAWEARSAGEPPKDYLRVRLDDPSLPEPLNAALFPAEGGGEAQLVWRRG
ncbi:MAG: DUF736 family protein [Magnetospirillum sp.]|nr:DUF736 family protein [Magnetospirillum sp.]